jgi:hypothetical protein
LLIADFAKSIAASGIPSAARSVDTAGMRALALVLAVVLPSLCAAQPPAFPDFAKWELLDPGARPMPYLNRPSLYLERGIALMPGVEFADGTIEFDVAMHGHAGFAGVVFRGEIPGQ